MTPSDGGRELQGDMYLRNLEASELNSIIDDWTDPLGEGGFGKVYQGSFEGMPVAVKVLNPDGLSTTAEYMAEVNLLAAMRHLNVVRAYARCDERSAVVMELMEGGSLHSQVRRDRLPWRLRIRALHQAAIGLRALHGCVPPTAAPRHQAQQHPLDTRPLG